jgi:hypothetical protein
VKLLFSGAAIALTFAAFLPYIVSIRAGRTRPHVFSWLIWGDLQEDFMDGKGHAISPSILPIYTYRETMHKVTSVGRSWVLTFRGPWCDSWEEFAGGSYRTLTHGRVIKGGSRDN